MEQAIAVTVPDRSRLLDAEKLRFQRRKATNAFMTFLVTALTAISVSALFVIIGYILIQGFSSIDLNFFTQEPKPSGELGGGIVDAILGTVEMLAVGSIVAVPLGLGTAIYLAEFGEGGLAEVIRLVLDMLAGVPSIVVGIFIWATVVRTTGSFSGLAGALGLAFIMMPIIARSVEEILRLVPDTLREAGLALGTPRWRVTLRVVIPTVMPGIATGVILAMARASGETAVLLLTALGNNFVNTDLSQPMSAIPVRAYNYAISAFEDYHRQAFASMLVLVIVIAVFSAAVRIFTGRVRYES
ncbi:MAG: phosphate ABC transporter permease PstA [Chloroflexota bacterium]